MKVEPLLYYSYLETARSRQKVFARYNEDVAVAFCASYSFDQINQGQKKIESVWYDPYLSKSFCATIQIDDDESIDFSRAYLDLLFCMGGKLYVWYISPGRSILVKGIIIKEIDIEYTLPDNSWYRTKEEVQKTYNARAAEYSKRILIMHSNFDMLFKQYMLKFVPIFSERSLMHSCSLETRSYDGCRSTLQDADFREYHEMGKPKNLAVKWKEGKSDYSAYFWFDESCIRKSFELFCGENTDIKIEFLIHIDVRACLFELMLYNQDSKKLLLIPNETYQLLVFKNKFEEYRSENYNQKSGAWLW